MHETSAIVDDDGHERELFSLLVEKKYFLLVGMG